MPVHELGPHDGLDFEHQQPSAARGVTFIFFNALTGDTLAWETMIAPALRARSAGRKPVRRSRRRPEPVLRLRDGAGVGGGGGGRRGGIEPPAWR